MESVILDAFFSSGLAYLSSGGKKFLRKENEPIRQVCEYDSLPADCTGRHPWVEPGTVFPSLEEAVVFIDAVNKFDLMMRYALDTQFEFYPEAMRERFREWSEELREDIKKNYFHILMEIPQFREISYLLDLTPRELVAWAKTGRN